MANFSNQKERLLAAVSYLGILFMIPLFLGRNSSFVQFHARQGLIMFGVHVVVGLIAWIPLFGWALLVAAWGFSVFALMKAYLGEEWELPYIGKYAKKLKI